MLKEYMTQSDMIEYFQVSDNTLRKWTQDGLDYIKLFSKTLYKKEDIEKFIEEKGEKK